MSRYLVALVLAGLAFATQAQPINERWLGRWQTGETTLIVTGQSVINRDQVCRWVGKEPTGNFSGCVAFYGGTTSKKEMIGRVQDMRTFIKGFGMDAASLAQANKTFAELQTTLNALSPDTFRYVLTRDADYQGSGDCGSGYILDKENVYVVSNCESAGPEFALGVTAMQKVQAPAAVTQLNGRWFSTQWKYGYELKNGVGTATASNSAKFKVGDEIIYLKPVSNNSFEGEQVYQDGKFHPIKVSLLPDGRLQFRGEKNISWTMSRQ
jgi:hypothetical protein